MFLLMTEPRAEIWVLCSSNSFFFYSGCCWSSFWERVKSFTFSINFHRKVHMQNSTSPCLPTYKHHIKTDSRFAFKTCNYKSASGKHHKTMNWARTLKMTPKAQEEKVGKWDFTKLKSSQEWKQETTSNIGEILVNCTSDKGYHQEYTKNSEI